MKGRLLSVCPLSPSAFPVSDRHGAADPAVFDEGALGKLLTACGGELAGLKLHTSAPIVKEQEYEPVLTVSGGLMAYRSVTF